MRLSKDFWRAKTTWLGVAAIVQAGVSWWAGALPAAEAIMAIYAALTAMFIRDTIQKNGEKLIKAGEIQHGTR